jgi:S-adenosylmethionine synthetase
VKQLQRMAELWFFGEITTEAYVDIPGIVRKTIKDIGYTKAEFGIEYETASIWVQVTEQSPDIAQGVDNDKGLHEEQGAGDQANDVWICFQ